MRTHRNCNTEIPEQKKPSSSANKNHITSKIEIRDITKLPVSCSAIVICGVSVATLSPLLLPNSSRSEFAILLRGDGSTLAANRKR